MVIIIVYFDCCNTDSFSHNLFFKLVIDAGKPFIHIQSFAYIWLHKGNQNEFLKHPKIKWLDGGLNFRMLKEFVLISFMKPDVRKTLNIIISGT